MAALLALLPLLIQAGPALIQAGVDVYDLFGKLTTELDKNTEWTPAEKATFDAHKVNLESQPWWQPQA